MSRPRRLACRSGVGSVYPSLSARARDLGGVGRAQAAGRARTGVGSDDSSTLVRARRAKLLQLFASDLGA
jgi:hypothetical protein